VTLAGWQLKYTHNFLSCTSIRKDTRTLPRKREIRD